MILFMLLRMFKYEFCTPDGAVERYLWYLYYVPIVLIPVVTIRAIMNMNLPDNAVLARKHTWMYIAAALLIIGVLTNDLHQTAFIFPPGMPMRESEYTHGVLFYIISAWVGMGILSVLFLSVRTCITRRMYKNLWIPLFLIVFGILYRYVYRFFDKSGSNVFQVMYAIPEFYCMIWVLFLDSLVVTRPCGFLFEILHAGRACRSGALRSFNGDKCDHAHQRNVSGCAAKSQRLYRRRYAAPAVPRDRRVVLLDRGSA